MTYTNVKRFLAAFVVVLALTPARSFGAGQTIEKVEVRGNHRIPQDTILYYVLCREGDVYDDDKVKQDFQALFKTGLFKDIRVDITDGQTGKIVTYVVEEKPIIRSIEYEGVKSFKKSDILDKFNEAKLGLTVDSPYEPTKVKKGEKIIKNLLVLNGRPLGTVTTLVEDVPPNSVRIVFKAVEGEKVRIGKITFEGNTIFKSKELKKALKLNKERGIFSIFKGTDKYHHDKFVYDLEENLKSLYQERGYLNMKYGEPEVKIVEGPRGFIPLLRKTKKQFYIKVPIDEGSLYRLNAMTFEGNTLFKSEQLMNNIGLKPGDIANYKAVKDGMQNIKKLYGIYGYIDFDISPSLKIDEAKKTADITFNIEQGRQYRVNQIEFFGNTRTRDKVLRREFQLVEQEVFSQQLLDLSVQRINQLGYFEKIEEKDYEIKRHPSEALVDVIVTVKEKGQQSIGLTGGLSGYQGSFIGLNYSTNNFLGYGDRISVDTILGTRQVNFSVSLTKPYFMDTNTLLGFTVYNSKTRFDMDDYTYFTTLDSTQLFVRKTKGFSVTIGRPLSMFWRFYTSYEFQSMSFPLDDINDEYRYLVEAQIFGSNPGLNTEDALSGLLRSQVTARLSYNSTDDYFFPTRGKEIDIAMSVSGGILGGDFNLLTPRADFKWYHRDKWISKGRNVFAVHLMGEYIRPFGDTVAAPFYERYYLGGETDMRGFDLRSVAPYAVVSYLRKDAQGQPMIDMNTGLPLRFDSIQPIGGDLSFLGQFEYRIPIVGPVTLAMFTDVGISTVTQKDKLGFSQDTSIYLIESTNNKWRASVGAEIQFMLPMVNAPFRLIFAYNPVRVSQWFYTKDYPTGIEYNEPRRNIRFSIGKSF